MDSWERLDPVLSAVIDKVYMFTARKHRVGKAFVTSSSGGFQDMYQFAMSRPVQTRLWMVISRTTPGVAQSMKQPTSDCPQFPEQIEARNLARLRT